MSNIFNEKYDRCKILYDKVMELDIERLKIELEKDGRRRIAKKIKEENEWIWVEGYKGTDENMKCRDFQYKLNKTYSINGDDINVCNCGFHLCLNLDDVFGYYDLNLSNRFFKVKALVKKVDKNKYGELSRPPSGFSGICKINKIVSKEIIFFKELTFDELKIHIQRIFPRINTKFEWYALSKLGVQEYYHRMFMNQMKKIRFSDTFSQLLFDKCLNYHEISEILNKAIAYSKENLSKDMLVYLLVKEVCR